ncbi:MAG: cytidylate kinase family protein [Nitrososphaerota archaeon]|nr:cytidylate kinase family protein [Nitrososphaerota archaeon]
MGNKKRLSVLISGMPSVGKTTAAGAVAKMFGLKIVAGGDMLKEMASERGYNVSGSDWWETKEGMKFLSERKRNPNFDKEVDRRLAQHLKNGGVVVTSYPMPWLSKDGIRFWFHASRKTRAARLAGRDKITNRKAVTLLKKRDAGNKRLYKKLYGIDFGEDLSPFHFIINTEGLSAKQVAYMTSKLVSLYAKRRVIALGK